MLAASLVNSGASQALRPFLRSRSKSQWMPGRVSQVTDAQISTSLKRHDRREAKEEIARLIPLGERLANGLEETLDTDVSKELRPVLERGD